MIEKLSVFTVSTDGTLSTEMESRAKINEIIDYVNSLQQHNKKFKEDLDDYMTKDHFPQTRI